MEFETTAAGDVDRGGGHGGGAGEQLAAERGGEPRRQIATVGRSGQHDLVGVGHVGQERDERRRPSATVERSEFHAVDVGRQAIERHRSDVGAGEHHPAAALGDRLVGAGGQDALTNRYRARSSNPNVRPIGARRSLDSSALVVAAVDAPTG